MTAHSVPQTDPPLDPDRIALGIKQPWGELILRGTKTLEIRRQSTNVRGRIYLYTSQKTATQEFARVAMTEQALSSDELPTGLLVGSVEIVDSRRATPADAAAACVPAEILVGCYAWELARPERLTPPAPVRFLPYGVWFYPFKRRGGRDEG